MKKLHIRRVAVLGAGTMGAQIAGYLADLGLTIDLFDVGAGARKAWDVMVKAGSCTLRGRGNITPRTMGKDDEVLGEADLVVEAVFEDPKVKEEVNEKLERLTNERCILATNTSGISIDELAAARGPAFRKRYFGLHFFNPLKHLPFAELTPGTETDMDLFAAFAHYAEVELGKGVVIARDTPNFIGNRIGGYALFAPFRFRTPGLGPAELDAVCKVIFGWEPLKTWDIVGLKLSAPVASNVYDRATTDPARAMFAPGIDWIDALLERGFTGRGSKTKAGFFALGERRKKLVFDFAEGRHVPLALRSFPSLDAALQAKFPENLQLLLDGDDEAATFARKAFYGLVAYSAMLVGEICDETIDIDRAMRWGFNWPRGPFELAQACGVAKVVEGAEAAGVGAMLPAWFRELAHSDGKLYSQRPSQFYARHTRSMLPTPRVEDGVYPERLLGDHTKLLYKNDDASVVELSDKTPIALVVATSRGGAAGPGTLRALHEALDWAERVDGSVIIGNAGRDFCPGANLRYILEQSEAGNAAAIEAMVRDGQEVTQRLTYSPALTIAAPHGFTLGGGSEIALGCKLRVVNSTVTWGQPEINPGLLPGWGGCMRLLRTMMRGLAPYYLWGENWTREIACDHIDPVWRTIAWAELSRDGFHAREMGLLEPRDVVVPAQGLGQPFVLARAKQIAEATRMMGFSVPEPFVFNLPGKAGLARFKLICDQGALGGMFPPHNARVATAIADVMCGGDTHLGEPVTEERLLELERGYFMELVMTKEAQTAMRRILKL